MSFRGLFSDFTGGALPIQTATVTLTNQNVKDLPTTPPTLVPTPGAGFQPVLWLCVLRAKFAAGAYTNINAAALMYVEFSVSGNVASGFLGNDATTTPVLTKVTTLLSANDWTVVLQPFVTQVDPASDEWGVFPNLNATGNTDNNALRLFVDNGGSGAFTGGNAANSLIIKTYYTVEAV